MSNINWIQEDTNKVERAAKRGNAEAAYELARRLLAGRKNVWSPYQADRDTKAAFTECDYAASRGVVEALNMQGYLYAYGIGVAASDRKAFRCFKRAALRGSALAWYNLGLCFEEGIGLAKPDLAAADKCLNRSAEKGYTKAQVARARILFMNARTPKERKLAMQWLKQEARKGNNDAKDAVRVCLRAKHRQSAGLSEPKLATSTLQFAAA